MVIRHIVAFVLLDCGLTEHVPNLMKAILAQQAVGAGENAFKRDGAFAVYGLRSAERARIVDGKLFARSRIGFRQVSDHIIQAGIERLVKTLPFREIGAAKLVDLLLRKRSQIQPG